MNRKKDCYSENGELGFAYRTVRENGIIKFDGNYYQDERLLKGERVAVTFIGECFASGPIKVSDHNLRTICTIDNPLNLQTFEAMTKEEIPNEAAYDFLVKKSKEYPPFTNFGLNRLPYVLRDAVAKCIQEYADQETAALRADNDRLRAALKELVECKELNAHSQTYMKTDDYYAYLRRFESAWEAARKLTTP